MVPCNVRPTSILVVVVALTTVVAPLTAASAMTTQAGYGEHSVHPDVPVTGEQWTGDLTTDETNQNTTDGDPPSEVSEGQSVATTKTVIWGTQRLTNNSVPETFLTANNQFGSDYDEAVDPTGPTIAYSLTTTDGNYTASYTRLNDSGALQGVEFLEIDGLANRDRLVRRTSFANGYVVIGGNRNQTTPDTQELEVIDTRSGETETTTWPPDVGVLDETDAVRVDAESSRGWVHNGRQLAGVVNYDLGDVGQKQDITDIVRYADGEWTQVTDVDHEVIACQRPNGVESIRLGDPSVPTNVLLDADGSDDIAWERDRNTVLRGDDCGNAGSEYRGSDLVIDDTVADRWNVGEGSGSMNVFRGDILLYNNDSSNSETAWIYDRRAGRKVNLRTNALRAIARPVRIDGTRAAWIGYPEGESDTEVFAYDGTGVDRLTNDDVDQGLAFSAGGSDLSLRVDDPYVVWTEEVNTTYDRLQVYNANQDAVVATFLWDTSLATGGSEWDLDHGTLVWEDPTVTSDGGQEVVLKRYRPATDTLLRGRTGWESVSELHVSDGWVFARADPLDPNPTHVGGGQSEVYGIHAACENDVAIRNRPTFQAAQVSWPQGQSGNRTVVGPQPANPNNLRVYPANDTIDPDAHGPLHGEQGLRLVADKNTSLFGAAGEGTPPSEYPDARRNVTFRVVNRDTAPKTIRVEVEIGSKTWTTERTYRLAACSPRTGPGTTAVTLPAPVPNATGWNDTSGTERFTPQLQRTDREIELGLVDEDGLPLVDNDRSNHRYTMDIDVVDTTTLELDYRVALNGTEVRAAVAGRHNWQHVLQQPWVRHQRSFVEDAYPIGEDGLTATANGWLPLTAPNKNTTTDIADYRTFVWYERQFLKSDADKLVVVDPHLTGSTLGYTYGTKNRPRIVFVAANSGNTTLAHELAHKLGLGEDYNQSLVAPEDQFDRGDQTGIQAHGYRVDTGQFHRDNASMMSAGRAGWIRRPNYLTLLSNFTEGAVDPPILQVSGVLYRNGTFDPAPFYQSTGIATVTENASGSHTLLIEDDSGTVHRFGFTPRFGAYIDPGGLTSRPATPVALSVPIDDGVRQVSIRTGNRTVFERTRSDNSPSVSFTSPEQGATLPENATIEWETSDPDGDAVRSTVFVSSDGGRTRHLWRADTTATTLDLSRLRVENLSVTLVASDGINTVEATANFTVNETVLGDESPTVSLADASIPSGQRDVIVTVTDEAGAPVEGATVEIQELGLSATTNSSGKAMLSVDTPDPGDYEVSVRADQYADATATLTVETGVLPTTPGEPGFGDVLEVIQAFSTNSEYADTGVTPGFGDVLAVVQAFTAGRTTP